MTLFASQRPSRFPQRLFAAAALAVPTILGVTSPAAAQSSADPLAATLDAHGGVETWNDQKALRYALADWPLGVQPNFRQVVDLDSRYHYAESDTYTAGISDDDAWITPGPEALGLPPAFVLHGNSYFVMMPFVFADPGVTVRELPDGELLGDTYPRLGVSFGSGVGDTADDDYILYLDPQTRRLHAINFSLTHTAIRGDAAVADAPRKVLVFESWQDADGLLVPESATFHGVENGVVDPQGATFRVAEIGFSTAAPQRTQFEQVTQAEIE